MRCPKCGYISFDQVGSCAKCSVVFKENEVASVGTVLKVVEPSFLSSVVGDEALGTEAEFNLSDALVDSTDDEIPGGADEEADERVEEVEDEVPMVDLSQFGEEQEDEASAEESGISMTSPEEEESEISMPSLEEEEPEISLTIPEDEEEGGISMTPPEEEESEISLALPEDEEESAVSAEESSEEEETGIEFQLEDDDEGPGLDFALEEPIGFDEDNGETAAEEEAVEFESEEMPTIALESDEEEVPPAKSTDGTPGSDLLHNVDADIEDDEPEDEDMVFNLEDIDMSDLVIEESKDSAEGPPEDSTLGLENYLNAGGDDEEDKSPPPMDLTLEDGELTKEEDEEKGGDLPEIEL